MLTDLCDITRYGRWQAEAIYEPDRHSGEDSEHHTRARAAITATQRALIDAVEAGPAAASTHLFAQLGVVDSAEARRHLPALPNLLTVAEMQHLPLRTARRIGEALDGALCPVDAATPGVWALCHAAWIADGHFGNDLPPVFLDSGNTSSDEHRTRNFLRRTGGLERIRGKQSVFVNCAISAAYWQWRIASDAAQIAGGAGEDADVGSLHAVLHDKATWVDFVALSLRRFAAINSPRGRAAGLLAVAGHRNGGDGSAVLLERAMSRLAELSHSYDLASAPWSLLCAEAQRALSATHPAAAPT